MRTDPRCSSANDFNPISCSIPRKYPKCNTQQSTRHLKISTQNVPVIAWVHKRRMRNQRGAADRGWRPNWGTVGRWSASRRRDRRANSPWFPAMPGSCDYSNRWQSPDFPSKQCEGNLQSPDSPPIPKIVAGHYELLYWDKLVKTRKTIGQQNISSI